MIDFLSSLPPIKWFIGLSLSTLAIPPVFDVVTAQVDDPSFLFFSKLAEGGVITMILSGAVYFLWKELNTQRKLTEDEREKHRQMLDLHKSVVDKIDEVDKKVEIIKDRMDRQS